MDNLDNEISSAGRYSELAHVNEVAIQARYPGIIAECIKDEFETWQPTPAMATRMESTIANWLLSNLTSGVSCGIVVSGYGDKEHYPSAIGYEVEGKIFDVFKVVYGDEAKIDDDNPSAILAYAQRRAAELFVTGVDPGYQRFIETGVQELLPGLADEVAKHLNIADPAKIDALRQVFENRANDIIRDMRDHREETFIQPLYDAVELLDKLELATLAENLVGLSALKQKVSLDLETVGGPIDVAIVSKHDGFIWIKRKHYFSPDLNPFFTSNYLKFRR